MMLNTDTLPLKTMLEQQKYHYEIIINEKDKTIEQLKAAIQLRNEIIEDLKQDLRCTRDLLEN
jgi:hypothetical protein